LSRYLSLAEALELHRELLERSGGASGVRDLGALESALAQPQATFDGQDLYPTLAD
jgi:death-on-curing protein